MAARRQKVYLEAQKGYAGKKVAAVEELGVEQWQKEGKSTQAERP